MPRRDLAQLGIEVLHSNFLFPQDAEKCLQTTPATVNSARVSDINAYPKRALEIQIGPLADGRGSQPR